DLLLPGADIEKFDWDPLRHPRGAHGRFVHVDGDSAPMVTPAAKPRRHHTLQYLPEGIRPTYDEHKKLTGYVAPNGDRYDLHGDRTNIIPPSKRLAGQAPLWGSRGTPSYSYSDHWKALNLLAKQPGAEDVKPLLEMAADDAGDKKGTTRAKK